MNNKLYIEQLLLKYREVRSSFVQLQYIVKDVDFVNDYTEDEQLLILKEYHALEDYCDAMLRRARYQIKMMREQDAHDNDIPVDDTGTHPSIMVNAGPCCQVCGDAIATHHCGQDAACQVGDGNAAVKNVPDSIKELEGMQVVFAFLPGHRCDGCSNFTECNRNWKKVELVGGYMLCLAPLPNSIVTE